MINSISQAAQCLRAGQMVILVDDVGKTLSGYLLKPAATISAQDICFMVNRGSGVICAALGEKKLAALGLSMMTSSEGSAGPDFTTSIDGRQNVTTGISAADRANTLRTLATTLTPQFDLVMPGHIFPLRAKHGGVLVTCGIAEAVVDLLSMADLDPVGAICHCLDKQGNLSNQTDLNELATSANLKLVAISDIIRHRLASETIVEQIADAQLPTKHHGLFRAVVFRSKNDTGEHLALVKGQIDQSENNGSSEGLQEPVLARVQSENRIGDLLGIHNVPTRQTLHGALNAINKANRGIFVYLRHPRKCLIQAQVEAINSGSVATSKTRELRETGIGVQILSSLGAKRIKLLTNSTHDLASIDAFNLDIVARESFEPWNFSHKQ